MPNEDDTNQQNANVDPSEGGSVVQDNVVPDDATSSQEDVTPQPTAAPAAAPTLSPEVIQALAKATAGAVQQAQPQQQQQQLSPEEYARIMNVFTPTQDHMKALGLSEEALPHFNTIVQGIQKQAQTMAALQVEALRRQVLQQLEPLRAAHTRQVEQELKKDFLTAYPEFTGFDPVLQLAYTQLQQEGYKADSKEAAFKTMAERARGLVKQLPQGQQPQKQNKMSTVSTGGQGGAGQGQGGKGRDPAEATARFLFG